MYSIEQLKNSNILIIYLENQLEWDKLNELLNGNLKIKFYGPACYSVRYATFFHGSTKTNVGTYSLYYVIITLNDIKENNMKKIIGYKVPYDINTWIRKGDVLTNHTGNDYCKKENQGKGFENYLLGNLVTTWKPIYADEFKVGDWLICDTAQIPKANKVIEVNDTYYATTNSLINPCNAGYTKDLVGLRLATAAEIANVSNLTLSNGKVVKIEKGGINVEGVNISTPILNTLYNNTTSLPGTTWAIQYNNFDVGCYKNITRDDIKNILEAIKNL